MSAGDTTGRSGAEPGRPGASDDHTFGTLAVTSGDVSLHVTVGGPEGAPVIVFVHGYPDTSRVWRPVMARLADRYRVVAYDLRGFGGSTAPAARRYGWSLAALTADFIAVADAVSPDAPVHLVGHDWGSVQSWAFAVDERAAPRIASFTSISGPSLDLVRPWVRRAIASPRRLRAVLRQSIASGYVGFFQLPVIPELFWRVAGGLVSRGLYAMSGVDDPAAHVAPTFASDAKIGLALYRQNIVRRTAAPLGLTTGALAMPVQLVVPARDRFLTPALYEDLPSLIPGLVRRDVAAGHWVPLSHPGPLARWIDELVASIETDAPSGRSLRRATHRPDRRRR